MRLPTILILGALLALGGCATTTADKLAVCDGKHRRPANLYGSVFDPASQPKASAKPAASAAPASSFPSCE